MSWSLQVFVRGVPQPKGSTRAFLRGGRVVTTGDCLGTKKWQAAIADTIRAHRLAPPEPVDGPVYLDCLFLLPRGKTVKREHHTVKPDRDKLLRAVQDALTGVVYRDDSQVVGGPVDKRYVKPGEEPGVLIAARLLVETEGDTRQLAHPIADRDPVVRGARRESGLADSSRFGRGQNDLDLV